MKQKYELMAILSSQIADQEIQSRLKDLRELLSNITFEELWGIRPFAYRIQQQDKGFYAVWNFEKETDLIHDLEQSLSLFPDLLRYLMIRVPKEYQPISLKTVEEGLLKLREKKAEKRAGKMERERPPEAKRFIEKPKPEQPAVTIEIPEKKKKSLDDKLKDIMSDEDLGF